MFLHWAGCLVKIDTCISLTISSLAAQKYGLSISLVITSYVDFVFNTDAEGTIETVIFLIVVGAAATSVHPGVGTVLVFDRESVGEGIELVRESVLVVALSCIFWHTRFTNGRQGLTRIFTDLSRLAILLFELQDIEDETGVFFLIFVFIEGAVEVAPDVAAIRIVIVADIDEVGLREGIHGFFRVEKAVGRGRSDHAWLRHKVSADTEEVILTAEL